MRACVFLYVNEEDAGRIIICMYVLRLVGWTILHNEPAIFKKIYVFC